LLHQFKIEYRSNLGVKERGKCSGILAAKRMPQKQKECGVGYLW
jgi:hypothetical protein